MSTQVTNHRSNASVPELIEDNPILRKLVWGRMHNHNDNWMAATVGDTGSGKSWASLRIAEAVDPNFSIDQVAFNVREFLELVRDDSYGRGSVIVFEEASVEASAHEWYSKSNRVLAKVLDTWRNQNRGAIFTLPAFGQLQKPARGRMSALIQMHQKNEDEGYTIAKYKRCQQNTDTGKIYKKAPRFGGRKYRFLKIQPPSEELREAYEQKKAEYNNELLDDLMAELVDEDEAEAEEEMGPRDVAREVIDNGIEDYVSQHPVNKMRYVDRELLQVDYGLSREKGKQAKKLIEREVDL